MPFRPRRWSPSDFSKRRATIGYSGSGVGKSIADVPSSSAMPVDDMMPDPGYENTPGYNPETAVYPAYEQPQVSQTGLLPPVSRGGGGPGSFSIGNAAHGTINLGNILGPRANPAFNPTNPTAGQLPYQTPGFFRRMFGDTGSDLNSAYIQNQNAQTLFNRERAADWARKTAFEKEKQQAGFDQQWNLEKARLDMDAARANLSASTALKEREIQQAGLNERDAAERAAREEERYGPDPIIASMLKRQEAESRVGFAGVKPLGSGSFARRDPYTGEIQYFVQEGGTSGGVMMWPDGSLQIQPSTSKRLVGFDPNNPGANQPSSPGNQPSTPPPDPNRLAADEIELLRKAAGAVANEPSTNTPPTPPWYKRILDGMKPMGYRPMGTDLWWK